MVENNLQSTISLSNEREVLDLVANSIMGLWDVVNNLTRLRPTRRERYRVCSTYSITSRARSHVLHAREGQLPALREFWHAHNDGVNKWVHVPRPL
jgi:hypothetical protein